MSTCTKVRSSGEICGRPCASGQAKDRCSKHKGLDPKEILNTSEEKPVQVKKEKAPKPGSKKWQELSSGGSGPIVEKNPYSICAVDLSVFDKKSFDVLSNYDGSFLVKGTPIYNGKTMKVKCGLDFSNDLEYMYLAENFKVEILKIKTHNGKGNWGNIKVPVVKNQSDLQKAKPPVTFMEVNTCVVKKAELMSSAPGEEDTYESLFTIKTFNYFFPDFDEKIAADWRKSGKLSYSERDILLFNAGNGYTIKNFDSKDDVTEKVVDLSDVSDDSLIKLHSMKLKWRIDEDDTKYAKYLVKVSATRSALDTGSKARASLGL